MLADLKISMLLQGTGDSARTITLGQSMAKGLPPIPLKTVERDCWDWDDGWRNVSAGYLPG
eukprot:766932-Hanusia_phi.AAC.5